MTKPRLPMLFLSHLPWLLLAAAAPFYLVPLTHYWQAFLLLPLAGLAGWYVLKQPLPATRFNRAILVLALAMLVSSWVTYDLALSLPKLAGLVFGLAVFFVVAGYSTNRKNWLLILLILIVLSAGIALVGLMGMQRVGEAYSKIPFLFHMLLKIPSVLPKLPGAPDGISPNEVGGVLLWAIYPAAAMWLSFWKTGTRTAAESPAQRNRFLQRAGKIGLVLLVSGSLLVIAAALVLTQSRAAYAGFLTLLVILFVLILPRNLRKIAFLIVTAGALVLAFFAGPKMIETGWNSTPALSEEMSMLSTGSLSQRVQIWGYGISLLRDFPLTGIGMNVFRFAVYQLFPFPCGVAPCDLSHAHNELIQAGLDLGLPGALALLALYVIAFQLLVSVYRLADRQSNPDPFAKWMALGLGGGLFSHFIYGLFDAVALGARPGFLFWLLLGLIWGLYRLYASENNQLGYES